MMAVSVPLGTDFVNSQSEKDRETFYEVKAGRFYEVKAGRFYEVKAIF